LASPYISAKAGWCGGFVSPQAEARGKAPDSYFKPDYCRNCAFFGLSIHHQKRKQMTAYLLFALEMLAFGVGIYLFLISFRIYRPKFKTEKAEEKFDNFVNTFGNTAKIASLILILNGIAEIYSLLF
jgi:hypothetical protein